MTENRKKLMLNVSYFIVNVFYCIFKRKQISLKSFGFTICISFFQGFICLHYKLNAFFHVM